MNNSNSNKIIISGAGCALADLIYNRVSFGSPGFQKFISQQTGDGGLSPGKLVFTVGGTYLEPFPGEKRQRVQLIQEDYKKQLTITT